MDSARLSALRKRREEQASSSSDSEDESSSSSSSSGSSSSSRLSSSASSRTSTEDEAEDPKSPANTNKQSNAQSSVKTQSSASSSYRKSSDSVDVNSKSIPEPAAAKTSKSPTREANAKTVVKDDDKTAKKAAKLTENESDGLGARKSKIPFLETSSSKKVVASTSAETRSEELPNLSARKSITTKKATPEAMEESSGKVEIKSEELQNLSAKKSTVKKSSAVEEVESEKTASKISGIRGKIAKVSTQDDAVKDDSKGKALKENAETASNEIPEKNSKEVSGKISKLYGAVKQVENLTEERESSSDSTKKPLGKLSGSKLKKSSGSANEDDDAKTEKVASDAVMLSVSKKNPGSDRTVDEPSADSEKISKIPKFKKSGETNNSAEEKMAAAAVEKPAKLISSEKQKSKETVEDEKVEKPAEKVGKKSKVPPAENSTPEDEQVEKAAEKVGKKSKISSAENTTAEVDIVDKPVEKVGKKSKISSAENTTAEDEKVETPVEKVGKKSKISSPENTIAEDEKVEKAAEKVGKKSKISSAENTTAEDDKVEKSVEKVSKKSKISSAEKNTAEDGVDKKSEVLDIEGSSGLILEVGSNKETAKKRKKSPIKDTADKAEGEDERKPSETLIDDFNKPSADIKTDKDQASGGNKLSADSADLEASTKAKKGSKRSSKSPTPVNETMADENPSLGAVESVEKITNNELESCGNKLSDENAETEAPAKIKKVPKKSSKSPTPANEAIIADDEKPTLEVGGVAGKLPLDAPSCGVDLESTSTVVVVVVDKVDSTTLELTGTRPAEENPTGTVLLADNLCVAGESVAKETGATLAAKEIEKTNETVDDETKASALKKSNDKNVVITVQESPNTGAKFETLEKPKEEKKTADETETAATQIDSKPKTEETDSVPVETAATVEPAPVAGGSELGPTELDDELKFDARKETVDDFIQRILSEVRSSDQHLKELAKELPAAESEEAPVKQSDEQTNKEAKTIVQVATKEAVIDDQVTAKPPTAAAANRPTTLEQTPKEDNDQVKQRTRYPADEDEELAILAKYFAKKEGRQLGGGGGGGGTDPLLQDVSASDELDSRSLGAAEIMRRRRLDQGQGQGQGQEDYDFDDGSDYGPPFARTMAGPKVSRRNFQRYNFGESDLNGREEGGFVSRFRRERHGSGALPEEAFVPRRSEETSEVVRQKSRGVRALVEKQSEVVDTVKRASKGLDELEREIIGVKQMSLGYRTHVEALETAFDAEARTYDGEYQAAVEGTRQRRPAQPQGQRKREDFVGLMFGSKRSSVADPTAGVDAFSTPAVASFMNIYGLGQRGGPEAVVVNGVAEGHRPAAHEFGLEAAAADGKVGPSKVDDYMSALERRYELTGRKDKEPDAGISGWSSTVVSGIDVGTSASDELLSRIRAKYPIASLSSSSSSSSYPGDPTGSSSRYTDLTSMSGYIGPSSNGQWSSNRGPARGSSGGGGYSGGGYSASSSPSPSDGYSSWRDKGTSGGRRSNHFGDDVHGGLGSGSDYSWRRAGGGASGSYLDRPFSTGSRTRRT